MLTEKRGYVPRHGNNWNRANINLMRYSIIETQIRKAKKEQKEREKAKTGMERFREAMLKERGIF